MTPTRYLQLGSGLVLVIISALVAQNWFASDRVSRQHRDYLEQQALQDALESLRASTNRIVSSSNEAALLALASGAPPEAGQAAAAPDPDEEPARTSAEALDAEKRMIADAEAGFQTAFERLQANATPKVPGAGPAEVAAIGSSFSELRMASDSVLASIAGAPSREAVFEAKELQEDAEQELLEKIGAMHGALHVAIESQGGDLAADFQDAKTLNLLAGLLAGCVLIALGVFLLRRIDGMFAEIGQQNERVAAANTGLESALDELKSLQQKLVDKEKLSTLGRLTATVSHELRNPLAAVRNSLFVLKRLAGGSPEMLEFVNRADRNVGRCDNIISDLLEYTRLRDLEKQLVDLRPMLAQAAKDVAAPGGVSFEFDMASEPVMAEIDPVRFPRAIINLAENAAQSIASAKRPGVVKISCHGRPEGAVIVVEDNGIGIPDAIKPKIFDALFTTKNFGAGLGLGIAQNLATQHGGTIAFESETGKGAKFRIVLPACAAPAVQVEAA
jgi:signal transduction histidine kinase